jgi:RNA-directed DNA polymerase
LSPLLANIALSVLDEHAAQAWAASGTPMQRHRRRQRGEATWRLVRYADDFVVMVAGSKAHAEAMREQVAAVLAPMGLHLAAAKTRTCHIDEGFDFLGFRIQRHPKRGTAKRYIYTYPSKQALVAVKAKVRALTRETTNQTLAALCAQLNLVLRGWTTYFRHSVAKATFNYLCSYAWQRVTCWLRHKHPRASWKQLRRRYLPDWWPTEGRVRLANPPRSPSPGIATEEHGSLHHGRARHRHRYSPPAWARGEPDAWRHARPVRSGPGNQVVRKGDTAPRPDPYKAALASMVLAEASLSGD